MGFKLGSIVVALALAEAAGSSVDPIDQISLSLTDNDNEMAVTWVSYEPYKPSFAGSVSFWPSANPSDIHTVRGLYVLA